MELVEAVQHHVVVEGDVTEGNISLFRQDLNRAVNRTQHDVVLDLTRAEKLDGLALGLIVHTRRHLHQEGRKLRVLLGKNGEDVLGSLELGELVGH